MRFKRQWLNVDRHCSCCNGDRKRDILPDPQWLKIAIAVLFNAVPDSGFLICNECDFVSIDDGGELHDGPPNYFTQGR